MRVFNPLSASVTLIGFYIRATLALNGLISRSGDCKTFHGYFYFAISVKIRTKVSLNIFFSTVNECNCNQICYRNSNFVTICRDVRYTGINIILWSKLGKRESQTGPVFDFAGISFLEFVVLKLYAGTKCRENGQKSRNLIPVKFNTFKVAWRKCFAASRVGWGEWPSGLRGRDEISRFPILTPLSAWPSLRIQPHCEGPGVLPVKNW